MHTPVGRALTFGGLPIGAQVHVALYELSGGQTHVGASADGFDPMAILTPAEQWAYAVTVPLNRSALDRYGRVRIKISILVHQGCVGIGVLQRDESSFVQEVSVAGSSGWHELALETLSLDTAGPLVIRNHSALGPCRVQLRIVDIEPVANEVDRQIEPDRLARAAQRPLGPLFAELSADTLIELAESLAIAPRLHPVPGWRFDAFTASADPGVHIRHGLWCAAKAKGFDRPFVVPWHEGTKLVLHLDNDLSHTLFSGACYEPN